MLAFKNQAMKLNHLNVRRELAGKNPADGRTATDLRLTVKGGNDILDKLSPHLRGSFYQHDDEKRQGDLVPGQLTKLIHPLLQTTYSYDLKCAGYTVAIDHGIDEEDPITLTDSQVNDFKVTVMEGGTVAIAMRAAARRDCQDRAHRHTRAADRRRCRRNAHLDRHWKRACDPLTTRYSTWRRSSAASKSLRHS